MILAAHFNHHPGFLTIYHRGGTHGPEGLVRTTIISMEIPRLARVRSDGPNDMIDMSLEVECAGLTKLNSRLPRSSMFSIGCFGLCLVQECRRRKVPWPLYCEDS